MGRLKTARKKIFTVKNQKTSSRQTLPLKFKKEKPVYTRKAKIKAVFKYFFLILLTLCLSFGTAGFLILYSWTMDMPEFDKTILQESAQSSYIYDRDGNVIAKFSSSENRSWIKYEDIPEQLVNAFICTEDIRFFEHGAIDPKRFVSALIGQLNGGTHGGSTITQQLVKNAYLTNEVTYKRKVQEIIMAWKLEQEMEKKEILEAYLNIIYFGESNYGIKAAADDYFGKDISALTLKECALLAGLVKNPNGYSPRRNMYVLNDISKTDKRTTDVLWNMKENGFITEEQYKIALDEPYNIKEHSISTSIYPYPHYVEYVIKDVINDMLKKEGLNDTWQNRSVLEWKIRSGGYRIYSSLDPEAQKILQETTASYKNYPAIKGKKDKPETAAVILDQTDGSIVAMTGSRKEPKSYKTLNRAVMNTMPVASIIKPLSAFAPAFENGASPGTVGYNYACKIEGYDITTDYPAGNMGPQKAMTYREALQRSSNTIPAKIVCQDISYAVSKQYLMQMGIDADKIQENGSGLVLGTSGINVLQMAGAYACLASGGTYHEPKSYTRVLDRNDSTVIEAKDYQVVRDVFSKPTSWLITNAMESVIGFNENVRGVNGIKTAGKTGTHEDKCATFAGYTPYYTSVIWVGADDYSSFGNISGADHAAPIFSEYMNKIHTEKGLEDKDILPFTQEDADVVSCETCSVSGNLATDLCRKNGCAVTEYFRKDTQPQKECDMHIMITECYSASALACESCPSYKTHQYEGLFIPADSPLSQITRELVRITYPDAVFEDEKMYCPYHGNDGGEEAYIKNTSLLTASLKRLQKSSKPEGGEPEEMENLVKELESASDEVRSDKSQGSLSLLKDVCRKAEKLYKKINRRTEELPDLSQEED